MRSCRLKDVSGRLPPCPRQARQLKKLEEQIRHLRTEVARPSVRHAKGRQRIILGHVYASELRASAQEPGLPQVRYIMLCRPLMAGGRYRHVAGDSAAIPGH
ncbi:hypothetical protein GCM10010439_35960 [Actinocorallia aurantiaca]|uniref:Transposase n=1 Tax=Actinocorallia aurantiaca TaxID=46204 RepID=A0ABP6GTZ8_9ACTN